VKLGDDKMADAALAQLVELSGTSDDKLIEATYHGAAGAFLFSRRQYKDAAIHLEEDINNPLSLKLLAAAYRKMGDSSDAKRTDVTLTNLNDPTLEQALIVPAFRKCVQNPSGNSGMKKASFKR
jgi:hypothetical protein